MQPLGRARQPSCDCRLLQEHHCKAIGYQRLGSADTQLAFKNNIPGPFRGPTATCLKHLLGKHLCNPRVVLHFASLSCKVGENDEQHCREALVSHQGFAEMQESRTRWSLQQQWRWLSRNGKLHYCSSSRSSGSRSRSSDKNQLEHNQALNLIRAIQWPFLVIRLPLYSTLLSLTGRLMRQNPEKERPYTLHPFS